MALSAAAICGGLALSGSPASAHTNSKHAAQPASVAANKKVILTFLKDILVEHHGDHAASYFTPNAQFHAGTVGTVTGNANIGGLLTAVVTAIPNLHPALQDVVAQGNEVMVRLVVSGTMSGNLLGIQGNGSPVQWDAIDLYRLQGGKISQEWAAEDLTAILHDTATYTAPWIH